MRHLKKGRKIGREKSSREALLKNLAKQVLQYGKVKTTEAKAKEVRPLVEKIITMAKKKDLHARRQILALFQDKELVHKIFTEVGRFEAREGGYCRILKVGPRGGDAAPMVLLELI